MEDNKSIISISVDLRKFRLRIHKATLHALGNPKYIQFLVNPKSLCVAIKGFDNRTKDSNLIRLSQMTPDNSVEFYSKTLTTTLMSLIPTAEKEATYRFTGDIYNNLRIAQFYLNTIQQVEGDYYESYQS